MSLSTSDESVSQKRTLSNLLAGRVVKRLKQGDCQRMQEAAVQLLEQQQNLSSLLREVENPALRNIFLYQNGGQKQTESVGSSTAIKGSLLVFELRCQAARLGVPVASLGVKMVLERLMEITENKEVTEDEGKRRELLTLSQRVQLCVLFESSKELLSQGAFCPKLLWQEYRRDQACRKLPIMELVYHLHFYNILTLKQILESDEDIRLWLVSELKALCCWTPPQEEDETRRVQQKVISTVVGVLVGTGFDMSPEFAAVDKRIALLCSSVLDNMLFWFLDTVENSETLQSAGTGAELWIHIFDASLCGVSVSADALRHFFTHSLTKILTYKPRLTVSDAIALQHEWTFAKANQLVTSLFCKLALIFSEEQLLCHLQQVLETHEVNWKHVLCFLSTLLVYNPHAQPKLRELLSRLLTSAFEGYDLENMITAFLLARQGALEGPSVFSSYSDWFKLSFSGSSGYHSHSKKSLVFLLKFLSDLVPYERPQYLKVHILHQPYVPQKHRSLLMEYVSLAKTRLADLKKSVEDMGLYEDISGAGEPSVQCQAVQDVQKAVSLFESSGKVPTTVMEASIFRRPYFLTRFLPALLTPRALPVIADPWMTFIEALKKADKIPAAQYSSYMEACQKQRKQDSSAEHLNASNDPLEVLKTQLQEFTELLSQGSEGEMSGQLSRISHTLSFVFPGHSEEPIGQSVIKLHINSPPSSELHVQVINMLLRSFCQCVLNTSQANPPNKQNLWASTFVSALLGNTQLVSSLMHRLWDLLHNQASLLGGAHLLGLAAFVVHLHISLSIGPLVQLVPPISPEPVTFGDALSIALVCNTHTKMIFCIRFCVAAVCYGLCRGDSLPQKQQQDYILNSLYKKLLYLIPRLLPEARRASITAAGPFSHDQMEKLPDLWSSATESHGTWRKAAWHLWRHQAFSQLRRVPQYQLLFSEWLANELRVQRNEDALSDLERQEYQQWACLEFYLSCPEEQGGCAGDMKILCSTLLNAIMDQHLICDLLLVWMSQGQCVTGTVLVALILVHNDFFVGLPYLFFNAYSPQTLEQRVSESGTCLPDILSRVQELVYEMEVTDLSGSRRNRADVHDLLFKLVCERCSLSSSSSVSQSVSVNLSLHYTVNTWNRVLLALPAVLFIKVKTEGGRTTLECNNLIEHVNQHQRNVCSPPGLLSYHLTAHFLKGVLCASVRCGHSAEEVDKSWSQISLRCPLLLVSTVHWWERLSPVLSSLWCRLCDGVPLPGQLKCLTDCQNWACSLEKGVLTLSVPAATALQLAASLHCALQGHRCSKPDFIPILNKLQAEMGIHCRQVLVFLFSLCMNDYVSALLYSQEKCQQNTRTLCSDLLSVLVDFADWLLIFKSNENGVYQSIAQVVSDDFIQLMPWAFYSLLLQQSSDLQHRAVRCPGFLHTAVLCYTRLLQIYLDGHELKAASELSHNQTLQILGHAKQFLLGTISQMFPAALSSIQLTQLQSQCAELDPDVASALSVHLDPHSLSPEMDFL